MINMKPNPSHVVFAPARECIYCGATDGLTTEHIIPYSLGGRFELPEASCNECTEITKKIEQTVGRGESWLDRDLQPQASLRPHIAGFPTAKPERGLTATFQTRFKGALNAY